MAKKRVNGEGTIGKRKDGRWEARYIVGRDPETGKQIRKSILGKTQAEVRAKLKDALAEAAEIDVSSRAGTAYPAGCRRGIPCMHSQTCARRQRGIISATLIIM